jgi:hypothetical protein
MLNSLPVQSRATQVLQDSGHPALRALYVEESDDALIIKGSVSSYYLKQLAQETLKAIRGPRQVVNQVEVVRE